MGPPSGFRPARVLTGSYRDRPIRTEYTTALSENTPRTADLQVVLLEPLEHLQCVVLLSTSDLPTSLSCKEPKSRQSSADKASHFSLACHPKSVSFATSTLILAKVYQGPPVPRHRHHARKPNLHTTNLQTAATTGVITFDPIPSSSNTAIPLGHNLL